jgi:hypothetical protein
MRRLMQAAIAVLLVTGGLLVVPSPASAGTVLGVTASIASKKQKSKTQAKVVVKFANTNNYRISVKMWVEGERLVANHGVKRTSISKKEKKRKVNFYIPCGESNTIKLEYKYTYKVKYKDEKGRRKTRTVEVLFGDALYVDNVPACKSG